MKKIVLFCCVLTSALCLSFCSKNNVEKEIHNFVEKCFPEATIQITQCDGNEYEVLLSDNTKLEFDTKGQWKEIDCGISSIYCSVPDTVVPQQIRKYITTNHPQCTIVKIQRERRHWEIELNNDIEIEFDKNYNVVDIDI